MSNIDGMIGYNKQSSSVNKLFAAYGNDIVDVAAGTGYKLNITSGNKMEFSVFLDHVFFQNKVDRPRTFNGTSWGFTHANHMPLSKYLFPFKSRLYLGNCKFTDLEAPLDESGTGLNFPSRVFYPDLYNTDALTWGLAWGRDGAPIQGTNIFNVISGGDGIPNNFLAQNIKIGDPLFITSFDSGRVLLSRKRYTVAKIPSAYRLETVEKFEPSVDTNLHWWVGSNWFDVGTDDNDQITGFGENNNILIFKLLSLWVYSGSQLRKVRDAVGTSSQRSVINKNGYTYYFHGSHPKITGIYRFDGSQSVKVSRAIDPFIQGMAAGAYDDVVSWSEGDELRWYIGDLTNANHEISMTKAVATYHTVTGAWDVSPINDAIVARAPWQVSNEEYFYTGTNSDQILKMGIGNAFKTSPIPMRLQTKVYYPLSTDIINEFTHVQVVGRQVKGLLLGYKLWNTPFNVDDTFYPLGMLTGDLTEFTIPDKHRIASGISFEIKEMGTSENDSYVEKITYFFRKIGRRKQ